MPRHKQKKHLNRLEVIAQGNLPEPLENLRLMLFAPRLKAPGTIKTYMETAERFVKEIGGEKPTDNDLRRYFIKRRQDSISERTLRKEFFHLKKLCQANDWKWPFMRDDTPFVKGKAATIALDIPVIEKLIAARDKYTPLECFYLAVSTTWGNRREEMSNLDKSVITEEKIEMPAAPMTIYIETAKHGDPVTHLIPPELRQIFHTYTPKKHEPEHMTAIFQDICAKAGVERKYGWGWHAIRRSLVTCLAVLLPKNNLDPALIADYMGWAKSALGSLYGAAMVSQYRRPEILDSDPYGLDKIIYSIHPFLPLWSPKPAGRRRPTRTVNN